MSPRIECATPTKLWPATPYLDDMQEYCPNGTHKGQDSIEAFLFSTASKTEDVDRASESTKDCGSETQSNPEEGDVCGVCDTRVGDTVEQFSIDGVHVCGECYPIFQPSGFVQEYTVCVNPLCRRRWRQLTPKALSWFCPSCKKHLEEGFGGAQASLEIEPMKQMYHLWCDIYCEIAEVLNLPNPALARVAISVKSYVCVALVKTGRCGVHSAEGKRRQWHSLMEAMRTTFPDLPSATNVKNWNSLIARKVYYRGVVHRCNRRFVCCLEASMEMHEDLKTAKRLPAGPRTFYVLDWQQTLEEGEEVCFMAFPNPAVDERNKVSRIVRVLARDDDLDLMQTKTSRPHIAEPLGQGNKNDSMLHLRTDDAASNCLVDSASPFADLMSWSEHSATHPSQQKKTEIAWPRRQLQVDSVDNTRQNSTAQSAGRPVLSSRDTDSKLHVHTNSHRRPSVCPLSPTAAYFGD